jgi:hypothetical protein
MMTASLCLMAVAEAGPVWRVLDDFRRLTGDREQVPDLGGGERDHSPVLPIDWGCFDCR